MKVIPLTKGYEALIDDEDYAVVAAFKWRVGGEQWPYAFTTRSGCTLSMHRLLMPDREGFLIDHIDGNGLNNQRANLRYATPSQNQWNRRLSKNSTTGYKGVSFNKKAHKYSVVVGGFETAEDAARAADLILPLAHGEFARLNFPRAEDQGGK